MENSRFLKYKIFLSWQSIDGLDSTVSIVTHYKPEGAGMESQLRRDFPCPSRLTLKLTQPHAQQITESLPRVKQPERSANHPPPSSADVAKGLELYLHLPLCLHRHVMEWPLRRSINITLFCSSNIWVWPWHQTNAEFSTSYIWTPFFQKITILQKWHANRLNEDQHFCWMRLLTLQE